MEVEATLMDRVLLLLSIKKEGKFISREHIMEKVSRDAGGGVRGSEINDVLEELLKNQLIVKRSRGYAITKEGIQKFRQRFSLGIKNLNLSYLMVSRARSYYPAVAKAMLPFLRDRAISVVKIFSHPEVPASKFNFLFVRYARRKPRPTPITVKGEKDLRSLVDAHAVDFIPYVHRLHLKEPDWFILDLDAGMTFQSHPRGFELLKIVTRAVVDVLRDYGITARVKFSGSRGMQVWSWLDNEALPRGDLFALYRAFALHLQGEVEAELQELPTETLELFYKVVAEDKPITTSMVAKKKNRADQVLIDWSSMKPRGDVRAPFSIHYKTGLVSCPVEYRRLMDFHNCEAEPEKIKGSIDLLVKAFSPELSDPTELLRSHKGERRIKKT
jgi:DNA primase